MAERLLDAGTDTKAKRNRGYAPLHTSCNGRRSKLTGLLHRRGVEVDTKTNDGSTPLHIASVSCSIESILLLLYGGADDDAKKGDGSTPLHIIASLSGRSERSARLVLDAVADVDAKRNDGSIAGAGCHHKIVWLLLSRNAWMLLHIHP
mmetsp:Transcript_2742/g.6418  ORF Transcript_2742/g.6418 Transcript_2742/m.6418 type:complete len:149 (-) Transcript_2742:59-505(-)